jgi:hypothetical protein
MQRKIKRHCAFSQIVTTVQQTLMYYIDFIAFMENPNRAWQIKSEACANLPLKSSGIRSILSKGGLLLKKCILNAILSAFRTGDWCALEF